jgi:hypothetical protein
MPKLLEWKAATGPSAGLVQQHFVKRRLAELTRIAPKMDARVRKRIIKALALDPDDSVEWVAAYDKINATMQSRHLTINFEEDKWFSTENTYDSYTQMYERSTMVSDPTTGKKKLLLEGNSKNPTAMRAAADDKVTFPANWDIQNTGPARGLAPGVQSGRRLMNQMAFGTHKAHTLPKPGGKAGETIDGVIPDAPYFNPKTKQLFAALNHGRRPHGSTVYYGSSHLVLADKFRANALYFMGDTFGVQALSRNPGAQAVPFSNVAAVVGGDSVHDNVAIKLIQAVYADQMMPDELGSDSLVEAHLFEPLPFHKNITEVVISTMDTTSDIVKNARKFAHKHGAKLVLVEPTGAQKMKWYSQNG